MGALRIMGETAPLTILNLVPYFKKKKKETMKTI